MRLGLHEFVERYALLGVSVVEAAYRKASHEEELDQERAVCKALITAIQVCVPRVFGGKGESRDGGGGMR